jgi:excisionase family DNA binding protein
MQPNVTTFTEAAEEKNCGRATLYRAVEEGRLNTAKVGQRDMILRDEKYQQFEPHNTGTRAARNDNK